MRLNIAEKPRPSMTSESLNPFPRQYPESIVLVRRSAGRPLSETITFAEIEAWLLRDAIGQKDMLQLLESFVWRLVAANFSIDRLSLHVGTLHPQLVGFAWNWHSVDGFCDEVRVTEKAVASDSYKLNPLQRLFDSGEPIRRLPRDASAQAEFPLMAELSDCGMRDYLAVPLNGPGYRNAITIATGSSDGFPEDKLACFNRVLELFALHVQRHSDLRVSSNTLNAYLGNGAAAKVLAGNIKRGSGEGMRAVIWVSDLRHFTAMSDKLTGADMLSILNAYFEAMTGAVFVHGGEVLKFIGDGVLAVFPIEGDGKSAASAALSAAHRAIADLGNLNLTPPGALVSIDGWRPMRAGIALHEGEVFFGNIGSSGRLDFTVIGPAVNEAFRVEALQKSLGKDIIVTEAAARLLASARLEPLGEHQLRGIAALMSVYSPS